MGDKLRRLGWLSLVVLFVATGLGIGVWGFWAATHQKDNPEDSQQLQNQSQGKPLPNFTPIAKVEKLQAVDLKEGTGKAATADSTVTVHYTGAVAATGIIFQSSLDFGQPFTTKLNQVIKGWTEGVPGMKAGGERRLLIPAADAYGANPPPGSGIPAGADLVFDIVLVSVE